MTSDNGAADSDSVNLGSNPSPPASQNTELPAVSDAGNTGSTGTDSEPRRTEPGTVGWLIHAYLTDPDSGYHRLRHVTKQNYLTLIRRIEREYGHVAMVEIRGKTVRRWHAQWGDGGKVTMAHSLIAMFRALVTFGVTDMEDRECERLRGAMSALRFKLPKPRSERLTSEQVGLIREEARKSGYRSIALAQAFQFECILRQRDVLGEFVPLSEPGDSDVKLGGWKWLRGIRWEEIDDDLILRHLTSKRQKMLEVDLKLSPMVMDELRYSAQDKASATISCLRTSSRAPTFRSAARS
jgi:hypothetical protein